MIFSSVQPGFNKGKEGLVDEVVAQTHKAFMNAIAVLEAAGASLNDVVKVIVFINNMDDLGKMNEVYDG